MELLLVVQLTEVGGRVSLGSSVTIMDHNQNLWLKQEPVGSEMMEAHLSGSIILLLTFPTELPAEINPQSEGPGGYVFRSLPIDLLCLTEFSASDKPARIAR